MMRPLLATLVLATATTAAAAPAPASGDLAVRSVEVRPSDPVVGPSGSVRLVVDVVARGADRVSVVLEPGRAPSEGDEPGEPGKEPEPEPAVMPSPPSGDAVPVPVPVPVPSASPNPVIPPGAALPATVPLSGLGGLASAAMPRVMGASRDGRPVRRISSGEWETWRFLPDKPLSRWYPNGPWTVTATAVDAQGERAVARVEFNLRRATEIEGLKVVRDGDDVRVTGTLLRVDPVGKVDYRPFAGQRVRIRFRPAGSSHWKTVGEAVTRRDGWFSARVHADGEGAWRAEYPGTSRYAADASPRREV